MVTYSSSVFLTGRGAWLANSYLFIAIPSYFLFQIQNFWYNVIYTTKELKNKVVLNLNQYCMHCYVVLSNVWDSNYSEQGSVVVLRYVCV